MAQRPIGTAQHPTGTVEPAPDFPDFPESHNVITLNNLTELNKPNRDSNFSLGAQAEVPTAPVDPTLTGDGNAPMPGGSATSGKAGDTVPRSLPSSDAPKSPETGQRNEIVPFEAKVPEALTPIA